MKPPEIEQIEELCEEIWSLTESGENGIERISSGSKVADVRAALDELVGRGLARIEAGRVALVGEGQKIGRTIVRRHRLAEVLFTQVLAVEESVTESTACEVEHILSEQVADSICTYLGHPPRCPHGKTIPRGSCCEIYLQEVKPLVARLPDLRIGESGTIVFIVPSTQGSLERVASLGVIPGRAVRLVQKRPSVVFEADRTTVAVDREMAQGIYVRREDS
jgi:DtxR family Mn-dependent transcriptional regulator